jgi:hypothetical protein
MGAPYPAWIGTIFRMRRMADGTVVGRISAR